MNLLCTRACALDTHGRSWPMEDYPGSLQSKVKAILALGLLLSPLYASALYPHLHALESKSVTPGFGACLQLAAKF